MAPVGYRFHPTEEEIVSHYLTLKMEGRDSLVDRDIGEVDFYRWEPWELPDFARIQSEDDRVWYFFCRLNYKYANSKRASRTTKMGFWKLTGKVRNVKSRKRNEVIGTKKTLVFQYKRPDSKEVMGIGWVVHEFQATNSPPDQRALVLCKLKHKASETSANLPIDEGEPSRRVIGSHAANIVVQNTTLEEDMGDLLSQMLSDGEDFNLPFSLQSSWHLDNDISDEEEDQLFADSLIVAPDEDHFENSASALQSDYGLPKSWCDVYGEGISYRATEVFHGESSNPHEGHNRSKEYRRMQIPHGDDVLLMGASAVGSVAAGTAEVNCIERVREELLAIHRQHELQRESTLAKDKAREATKPGTSVVLPQKDRKRIQVTNAKPDFKLKSNESASKDWKGRFIHLETPPSSHISCPPLLYLFKAVLGLVLFLIMLREAVVVR